ncbi:hypothetical protein KY320_01265 [Candidatus Woesearchaeota archaeon]|nr:hypothetical protein [Candidatus Woesearchaeota archaeon]
MYSGSAGIVTGMLSLLCGILGVMLVFNSVIGRYNSPLMLILGIGLFMLAFMFRVVAGIYS